MDEGLDEGWDLVRNGSLDDALSAVVESGHTLASYLTRKMVSRRLTRSEVARDAHLNPTYSYQILAGTRSPSRDKIIQSCFGLHLTPEEACEALELGGANRLSRNSRRDVTIAYYLAHGGGLAECSERLGGMGERRLIPPPAKSPKGGGPKRGRG